MGAWERDRGGMLTREVDSGAIDVYGVHGCFREMCRSLKGCTPQGRQSKTLRGSYLERENAVLDVLVAYTSCA
jgi:hypothetical protein